MFKADAGSKREIAKRWNVWRKKRWSQKDGDRADSLGRISNRGMEDEAKRHLKNNPKDCKNTF
jgi:hypothetical protein